ncbi:M15 family metallopeptidase [Neobacillus sp. NPDC093127]|uniref:M15 family metallopeptidase n=1 Tax=Neobacillus sp. NPDC093127 TaxID=3364296 RepID=UPI0037FD797E
MKSFSLGKEYVVLKLKRIGSSIYILILVLIALLFFNLFIKESNPFTERNINHSNSLPTELHPIVKERTKQLVQQAADKGIVIVITDGFRSADDQNRLYEKGRSAEGSIVTYAKGGESYHNFGLAIDFALKTPSGNVIWDMEYDGNKNGKADWTEVVSLAKALGFEWGGDWAKFKDYPHLQMNFGLTIADLQNGERPAKSSLTADTQ